MACWLHRRTWASWISSGVGGLVLLSCAVCLTSRAHGDLIVNSGDTIDSLVDGDVILGDHIAGVTIADGALITGTVRLRNQSSVVMTGGIIRGGVSAGIVGAVGEGGNLVEIRGGLVEGGVSMGPRGEFQLVRGSVKGNLEIFEGSTSNILFGGRVTGFVKSVVDGDITLFGTKIDGDFIAAGSDLIGGGRIGGDVIVTSHREVRIDGGKIKGGLVFAGGAAGSTVRIQGYGLAFATDPDLGDVITGFLRNERKRSLGFGRGLSYTGFELGRDEIILENYGAVPPVPEPITLALFALGAAGVRCVHRRMKNMTDGVDA